MYKYCAFISYVGTPFLGWQKQNAYASSIDIPCTVQDTIEKALFQITGEQISCVGSGRTDSGVHALSQVAHFVLKKKKWEPFRLYRGLNGVLPQTIRILSLKSVDLSFHAQKSALKKQYSYYFQKGPCALPHLEPLSWWIQAPLDLKAMQEALSLIQGKHDFKAFRARGGHLGCSEREIFEAEISIVSILFGILEKNFYLVRVRLVGSGFLKQMVRGIIGTLLQIGQGRRCAFDIQKILETGDRQLVGPTAPARALWLEKLWYPKEFGIQFQEPFNF